MSNVLPDSVSAAEIDQYKNVPALAPPPGVIPNFTAANPRADIYIIICSVALGLAFIFVLLRLYAKLWINRSPGWDDGMLTSLMQARNE